MYMSTNEVYLGLLIVYQMCLEVWDQNIAGVLTPI